VSPDRDLDVSVCEVTATAKLVKPYEPLFDNSGLASLGLAKVAGLE
jgi:hypothetical protein